MTTPTTPQPPEMVPVSAEARETPRRAMNPPADCPDVSEYACRQIDAHASRVTADLRADLKFIHEIAYEQMRTGEDKGDCASIESIARKHLGLKADDGFSEEVVPTKAQQMEQLLRMYGWLQEESLQTVPASANYPSRRA